MNPSYNPFTPFGGHMSGTYDVINAAVAQQPQIWQQGAPQLPPWWQQHQADAQQMPFGGMQFNPVDAINAKRDAAMAVLGLQHQNNFAMPKGVERHLSGQVINPAADTNPFTNGFFKPQGSAANPFSWQMGGQNQLANNLSGVNPAVADPRTQHYLNMLAPTQPSMPQIGMPWVTPGSTNIQNRSPFNAFYGMPG